MLKRLFIGTVILFITGFQVFAGDLEKYINDGYRNFKNENYKSAIVNFENALKLNDNIYDLYCDLGISYGMTGNGAKAEELFKTAIKKFPNEWRAYTFLGDMERARVHTPKAIDYYEKAISLPTMPPEGKKYYTNLIKTVIKEQQEHDKNIPTTSKPNISIDLDMNKWNIAYFKGTDQNWLIEYGLKNEDVIHYKWSKLITINFFDNAKYNFNLNGYYDAFVGLLRKQAASTSRKLYLNKISENSNEIYFIWSISERNESEICRIFTTKKGLYFVHFAEKKNSFTPEETNKIIEILKSVKIAE